MRFTVTALGSAGGRTVGQVVADIVRYLEPRAVERRGLATAAPAVPSGDGPSSYYADRGTEAGRWLGFSAVEAGLVGTVDPTDFARVLSGRDPRTGERLLSASGSAGRRPTLGAGQQTRVDSGGEPLYGLNDIAAALKITRRDAESLLAAGERLAVRSMCTEFIGSTATGLAAEPEGSYLVPVIDADGDRWVTASELDRCEHARLIGIAAEVVAASGAPDDQLSATDAARLAGVTSQYLRGLCRQWEDSRHEIEAGIADGNPVSRAYVVAHRGTRGQWIVTRANLVAFLERRAAPAVRVGFDLTLTTEKSLGVLALLGDEHTRRAVLDAIQTGNDTGLSYLEFHAAGARSKGKPVLVRGLTIASFRHLTSRALDPFPHHHNVIANSAIDEHGTRRALDARGLYTHAQAASAVATVQMRYQLTRALGVRWRRGRSGSWEIDGIADEVVREFSRRRNEIEDAVAELEAEIGRRSTLAEVQNVITGTRPPKEDVDPSTLVEGWWERARQHGLTPETLARCTNIAAPPVAVDETRLFEELASPTDGICAGHSIFSRSDVLVALADIDHAGNGPLIADAGEVERLADAFLASDHVVQLDTSGLKGTLARQELFTTREILTVQQRIIDRYTFAASAGAAIVPSAIVDQALGGHPALTGEQQHLVRAVCASGLGVQCAIGRAGAGKTTTMRVAAEAWTAASYHVIGAAVKGEAARQLAAGARIPTETVAWYLARADQPPLHDRTVLVIDEASTLSDRDLDALLTMAEHAGATVRLIGDPDQHGAVAAGGMFRHLCATFAEDTPELSTTHRVADRADRDAARLLRAGRTHDALAALDRAGHLHIADNDIDLYLGMLANWWDAHEAGSPHPMVDRRHYTRRVLNRLARQLRRANGELGDTELHATGDRAFATGDRVVARMAARHLHVPGDPNAYVRNGATGTITAVTTHPDPERESVEVCFDEIGPITLPRSFVDEHDGPGRRRDVGIDHAYAVTSYAVQGATFQRSTSRIDEGATRSETYVDITRGRTANHLFITRAPDPLDGEHLPKAPDEHLRHTVADRLHRSGPERAAIELPVLHNATALGRLLAHDPPAAWTQRLAPTPADPIHLRRHERAALEATLAYRHRRHPGPALGGSWVWALGSSTSGSAASHRAAVVELLDRYAGVLAAEHLPPDADKQWPLEQLTVGLRSGIARSDLHHLVDLAQQLGGDGVSSHRTGDPTAIGELLRALPYGEWLARSQPDTLGHHDPAPLHLQGPA